MLFSTPIFIFLFLPIVLFVNFFLPSSWRNVWILFSSLFFYAWGEGYFILVMSTMIVINYSLARLIEQRKPNGGFLPLACAICLNLLTLTFFKYDYFIIKNINYIVVIFNFSPLQPSGVHLPLGISFFTFHMISYLIDIHRGQAQAQNNPLNFALYVTLFPQLIAGPIVRYKEIWLQITHRIISFDDVNIGVRRFIIGFAKKMILANPLGEVADTIFSNPPSTMPGEVAWVGIICYTLQIYFDFSGYSDMAIGLARILGFRFPENFNYPYVARSVREFWQRWHITLSNWFRDYLYIPLGGNRVGRVRTCINLLVVFFLCGLWHGAEWTFVIWGLCHGFFLMGERYWWGKLLENAHGFVRHLYALLAVIIAWVFFRSPNIDFAWQYLRALCFLSSPDRIVDPFTLYLNVRTVGLLIMGIILATPAMRWVSPGENMLGPLRHLHQNYREGIRAMVILSLFVVALSQMAADTYNPFIYFRF